METRLQHQEMPPPSSTWVDGEIDKSTVDIRRTRYGHGLYRWIGYQGTPSLHSKRLGRRGFQFDAWYQSLDQIGHLENAYWGAILHDNIGRRGVAARVSNNIL